MIGPQFSDEAEKEISPRSLRQFAGISVTLFGLLFALSWYRHNGHPTVVAWIATSFAALVGLPGLVFPEVIRPVYLAAKAATRPIGQLVGIITLGIIYYGFLTPLAMLFRLFRRDNLARRRANVTSYWTSKPETDDAHSYLRQYNRQ